MSQIVAIDYGRKHVGLAVADSELKIAGKINHLDVTKHQSPFEAVVDFLNNQSDVSLLVIGLPSGLEGKPTQMSREVKEFANQLHNSTNIPYILWDETLTSQIANKKKISNAQSVHSEAARIILQEYLDHEQS